MVIIAPAAASAKDLMDCKYYHEEFYEFDPTHSMEKIQSTPRGTDWITRDDKLKKSHSKRP
ncbi:hypothetical protein RhiirA4_463456 [Rhizophagus irregularis]|uniref:Uncharacterized protein n=1 Tax=Rhizophagus irregularis TaxID=588596 RepID=A0A2I1GMZ7_9GLOM|nr:hypothetical protein RhiirA4_463456 [Rhizophagus irregularis]